MTAAERVVRDLRRELAKAQRGVNLPRGMVEHWIELLEAELTSSGRRWVA